MGIDTEMVALDSNAMTYLIEGLNCVSGPPLGREAESKIALVRSFFYLPNSSCFHLTPTVEAEYKRIKDQPKLENHRSWGMVHFSPVRPLPNANQLCVRTQQLQQHHSDYDDCRILAECEMCQIKTLITSDRNFRKNLARQAVGVKVCAPLDYWQSRGVAPGTPPRRLPTHDNPLSQVSWWQA
jgi:hypothetical protein